MLSLLCPSSYSFTEVSSVSFELSSESIHDLSVIFCYVKNPQALKPIALPLPSKLCHFSLQSKQKHVIHFPLHCSDARSDFSLHKVFGLFLKSFSVNVPSFLLQELRKELWKQQQSREGEAHGIAYGGSGTLPGMAALTVTMGITSEQITLLQGTGEETK